MISLTNYTMAIVTNVLHDVFLYVKKEHGPKHLHGKLNGIGGKVEDGETIFDCMERELEEEILVKPNDYVIRWCGVLFHGAKARVHIYRVVIIDDQYFKRMAVGTPMNDAGEELHVVHASYVPETPLVPNLSHIVPLVLDDKVQRFEIFEEAEND